MRKAADVFGHSRENDSRIGYYCVIAGGIRTIMPRGKISCLPSSPTSHMRPTDSPTERQRNGITQVRSSAEWMRQVPSKPLLYL